MPSLGPLMLTWKPLFWSAVRAWLPVHPMTLVTLTYCTPAETVMVTVEPTAADSPTPGLTAVTVSSGAEEYSSFTLTTKPSSSRRLRALDSESPTTLGMTFWLAPLEMW